MHARDHRSQRGVSDLTYLTRCAARRDSLSTPTTKPATPRAPPRRRTAQPGGLFFLSLSPGEPNHYGFAARGRRWRRGRNFPVARPASTRFQHPRPSPPRLGCCNVLRRFAVESVRGASRHAGTVSSFGRGHSPDDGLVSESRGVVETARKFARVLRELWWGDRFNTGRKCDHPRRKQSGGGVTHPLSTLSACGRPAISVRSSLDWAEPPDRGGVLILEIG